MRLACLAIFLAVCALRSPAQGFLDRRVSLHARHQPLARVLDTLASRGGFAFSYNSTILPQDSLVSAVYNDVSVRQILEGLLGTNYQYIQREKYLIIVRQTPPVRDNTYTVSGYVLDAATGKAVPNASVYEREQLQSALTDEQGFFRLRLKERYREPVLSVSKEWYEDTTLALEPGADEEYKILINPGRVTEMAPLLITAGIEHSWWGRLFLSSRERVQSLNLTRFFTSKPYQVSLLPSIGTQGRMGPQVTNTFSLNVIGGYSAGTRGVEIAGVFNLDKRDVRQVQMAGVLNVAGGKVRGLQAAGLVNNDMDSVSGVAVAGLANVVHGSVLGAQVAGAFNDCRGQVRGLQLSGFYNHASRLKGVQIGIINIADTSSGYSIGLLSIVRHGVHQLSLSYGEATGPTLTYKSGNSALYSILLAGYSPRPGGPFFTVGYGVGKAFPLSGRWGVITELTDQQVFDRSWRSLGDMYRVSPALTFRLSHTVSIFAGPRGSLYIASRNPSAGAHPEDVPPSGFLSAAWSARTTGWIGASAGLILF